MIEKKIIDKKLHITRTGMIFHNLGQIRGINPVSSYGMARTDLKATRIKYLCHEEIPPQGEMINSFIFYKELPLDIEGWKFNFGEVYSGESEKDIPLFQTLFAYLEDTDGKKEKDRRFEFP